LGWTVGAGIELGLTPNWSAKVEYDYLDFASKTYAVPGGVPFSGGIRENFSVKENFNAVKVGLNYRFGPSDPALGAAATELAAKAPRPGPYNWSGGYAGIAVGDRLSDTSWDTNEIYALPGQFDNTTDPASFFSSTVRVGGYLGYNWQFAPRWVAGIEGDAAWGNSKMSLNGIPGTFGNSGIVFPVAGGVINGLEDEFGDTASVKLGWDGSARGRLGFLVLPSVLFYGTGGVSFQEVDVGASCLGPAAPNVGGVIGSYCLNGTHGESFSKLLVGYTIGGGVEAALRDNWLGRLEGRYANYGRFGHTFFAGSGDDVAANFHLSTWTFLAGLAYKFDGGAPLASK
jgi:outer membrane immunogenic protein